MNRVIRFVVTRGLQGCGLVLAMSLVVFFGIHLGGNPVDAMVSPDADQAEIERAVRALGLSEPIHRQYLLFLQAAASGEFGRSFVTGEPAVAMVLRNLPATIELAMASLILAVLIGVPLGMFAGFRPGHPLSRAILGGSILGFSLPTFWVGLLLIMVFSLELGWFPSGGRGEVATLAGISSSLFTLDGLHHLLLPALNLSLLKMALVIRLSRAGVLEVMHQEFVRHAMARGISGFRIASVHVFRVIMIPIVAVLGVELGNLLAFSIVTESIFYWPGSGKLLIDSIINLDRPVVVAALMIVVLVFFVVNTLVDLVVLVLDPRSDRVESRG